MDQLAQKVEEVFSEARQYMREIINDGAGCPASQGSDRDQLLHPVPEVPLKPQTASVSGPQEGSRSGKLCTCYENHAHHDGICFAHCWRTLETVADTVDSSSDTI